MSDDGLDCTASNKKTEQTIALNNKNASIPESVTSALHTVINNENETVIYSDELGIGLGPMLSGYMNHRVTNICMPVRNKELEFVNSTVFLGITLDDRLQWGPHISKLAKRLSSAAYAVKKMRNLSDVETARLGLGCLAGGGGCVYLCASYLYRHVKTAGAAGPPPGTGHQRNRSLDSVLQRIPEDLTPTSPAPAIAPRAPVLALPDVAAGSDDSGIHAHAADDADTEEPTAPPPAAARSRESLDSGNPEDAPAPLPSSPPRAADASRNKDFLLRLFESKLFDMSMTIMYLFNSKEPGVQTYLANKLFSFPHEEVDFYLPQLATMYIEMADVAEVLEPYLVHRCRHSADFSLRLVWLLRAFAGEAKKSRAARLRDSILAETVRPATGTRRGHQRSQSDASALRSAGVGAAGATRHLGDLASGRAFDNGCLCPTGGDHCSCGAPRLEPQIQVTQTFTY
ncbi:Phosphatidylinositol 4-kinase beta [Eumeta japonica]|uniref:Phosphatidylinositol 4-kinase beta n=1 Tax=Eumeta variegata TaxID=151549 RepID=A0A4C1ZF47_EUMVA|nr:Phosphatidylinositol 4-kinase beta [Eumeta japonica]